MNLVAISSWILCGIVCAIIHKKKGYSPVAGFLWGFLFFVMGLIIVALENNKEEHDRQMAEGKGLSMGKWLAIFLGIGIIFIIIFLVILTNL